MFLPILKKQSLAFLCALAPGFLLLAGCNDPFAGGGGANPTVEGDGTFAITTPADRTYVNASNAGAFAFNGTCLSSGQASISATLLGPIAARASADCNTQAFSGMINLSGVPDGSYLLRIVALHANGGVSGTPTDIPIVIDRTAPVLTGAAPGAYSSKYINSANAAVFAVSGTCNELGRNVGVMIGGTAKGSLLCNGSAFSGNVDLSSLSDGAASLTFGLTDAAGNTTTTAAFGLVVDQTLPAITGLSNDATPAKTKSWTWACTDANSPCSFRSGVDTNTSYNFSIEAWGASTTAAQNSGDGTYYLHVQARDVAGNITSSNVSAVLDNTPPALAITVPATATYINISTDSASYSVTGTCNENSQHVTIKVDGITNGSGATCNGTTFGATISTTSVTQASHALTATLTDGAGNTATSTSVNVIRDVTPPTIAITVPANNSFINSTNDSTLFTISGTCSEASQPVVIHVDGATLGSGATCNGSTFAANIDATQLAQGAHSVTAIVTDAAGNSTPSTAFTITRDTVGPTVAVTTPASGAYINSTADSTTYAVSGTCSEASQHVTIKVDGSTSGTGATCSSGTFLATINTTGLTEATHAIAASQSDAAGNSGISSTNNVIRDVTAPAVPSAVALRTPASTPGTVDQPMIRVSGVSSGVVVEINTNSSCASPSQKAFGTASGVFIDLTSSPLAAGSYTFYAKATDAAGNASACTSVSAAYIYDNVPPAIAITAPASASYVNAATDSSSFGVSGSCSEASQIVTVKVDGTSSGVGATCNGTTFAATINTTALSQATHALTATIADAAGNATTSASISIIRDVTLPMLAISVPANASFITSANDSSAYAISGTCSEAGLAVVIKVDGTASGAGATCSSGTFSATINTTSLSEATHSLVAAQTDAAGNLGVSGTTTVTRDLTAPTIALTSPSNNSYISTANDSAVFAISGTCSEASRSVTLLVDGAASGSGGTCNGTSFAATINSTLLSQATHTLSASYTDAAGNSATATAFNITRDVTPPTVAITSPTAGSFINLANDSTTYAISGTCSENGRTVSLQVDGSATGAGGTCNGTTFTATINTTGLSEAAHSIRAVLSDAAGNSTTSTSVSATRDVTRPAAPSGLSLVTPASSPSATNATPTIRVSGVVSGDVVAISTSATCAVISQKAFGTSSATSTDLTSSTLLNGTYAYYAQSTDPAGNPSVCSSATLSYTYDTIAPSIAISAPANSTYIDIANDSTTFTVSGTCSEASQHVTVKVDGSSSGAGATCDGTNFSATVNSTALSEASHTISATVADAAGNSTSSTPNSIVRDVTAPSLAVSTPTNNTYITAATDSSTYAVSGTCNENTRTVTVKVDGITSGAGATCNGSTFSATINTTSLTQAAHSLTTTVSDAAGNVTTSSALTLTRDVSTPTIAITAPTNATYITGTNDSASFVVSGPCSEVSQTVTVKVDGTASGAGATCNGTTFSAIINSTSLTEAAHLLTATIADTAGNTTVSGSITVTRDVTNPTIAITTPGSSSYINVGSDSANYSVSGTCSESSQHVTIKVDGTASGAGATCTGATFSGSINSTALSAGGHSITAMIADAAGNATTSGSVSVTRDASAPTVAITAPATASFINAANDSTSFAVTGTCSESAQTVTIKVDGTASGSGAACTGTNFSAAINSTTLSQGSHVFTALIADAAGNSTTSGSITVTHDTSAPAIAITSPVTGSYIRAATDSATFTVSGNCSDASQSVTIKVDGSASGSGATCNGTTFSAAINTTGLNSATHSLTAAITDAAGNATTSAVISVTRDVAAPTIISTSPSSGAVDVAVAAPVTANFSENVVSATLDSTSFGIVDGGGTTITGSVSYNSTSHVATFTPSPALTTTKTYTVTIANTVTDLAGNPVGGPRSWSFTTVPAAPTAPTSLVATTVGSARITLTWTDNASNETSYRVERSSDNVTFAQVTSLPSNTTSYSDIGLAANTVYYYQVRAYNNGGYSAYSSVAQDRTLPAYESIAFRTQAYTGSTTAANSVTVSMASNQIQNDDVLIAVIYLYSTSTTISTVPSGWTLVNSYNSSISTDVYVYRKTAAGEGTAPSYTFGLSSSVAYLAAISAYSGVDISAPVDFDDGVAVTTSTTSFTAPTVTTNYANDLLVSIFCTTNSGSTGASLTPPSGQVGRYDGYGYRTLPSSRSVTCESSDETIAVAGSTGTRTATTSVSGTGYALSLVLKPALNP